MVSCPICKTSDAKLVKSWPISFTKEGEAESKPQFYIGIFECPNCNVKFRSRLESLSDLTQLNSKSNQTLNIKDLVGRINDVKVGLTQSLRVLKERIGTLETERANLLTEVAELRKSAESRADTLENEVHELREELKSLRELLGSK